MAIWSRQALVAASGVVALTSAASVGVAQESVVNVYSARHYDTDQQLCQQFTEQTGTKVNLIEGDADQLIERIKAEGANSPADVLITVDAGRLHRAVEAGLLSPVDSQALEERIPDHLQHPDDLWFGLSQRVRGIVYAKDRVDPAQIESYEDLAGPDWEARVCIRSSSNIYNQSLVASMIESEGAEAAEAWANGIVANMARPPQGGDTDQIQAVAAGECDVAVVNHYYLVRLMKSQDPAEQEVASKVDILFPNQNGRGAHANISGAGVLESAPNPEQAVKFLEYLTTPEAQKYFAEGNNEYPVVEGVEPDPVLAKWGDFKTDTIDAVSYGENNAEAVKIMDRAGWK
jgi:iron(III) transport system substrate-binding protein